MKQYFCTLICLFCFTSAIIAQRHAVTGIVLDSTKTPIPGATVRLTSAQRDTMSLSTDAKGSFQFPPAVKATKITITISAIGYQGVIKHYQLDTGRLVSVGVINIKNRSSNAYPGRYNRSEPHKI